MILQKTILRMHKHLLQLWKESFRSKTSQIKMLSMLQKTLKTHVTSTSEEFIFGMF